MFVESGETMKELFAKMKTQIVFIISAIIIFMLVIWGLIGPKSMESITTTLMDGMTKHLGWFYVAATAFYVGFCIYLGVGPYRKMKLGKKHDEPEYSYFTWIGLLFAAGMGVGLVFWGFAEPLSHYITAPGAATEPETEEAVRHGLLLGVFHWGIQPWAIYAIVALGLAFAKYRKNLPGLVSSAFYPLIGNQIHGWQGKTIDISAIVATTVGIATSFGLSTMQFGKGLSEVFSLPDNNWMMVGIVVVITVIFLTSALTGLDKGMKYLSVGNLWLSAVVLIAVLLIGPTVFLLEHLLKTIGDYGANIFQYTFNTTPYSSDNQWMGDWTLFYWAWIISWSPFVGTFIARVSKGRTLGEFMLGVLVVPTAVTIVWFVVMGGTGLHMELMGQASFAEEIKNTPEVGLFRVLEQLPMGQILSVLGLILIGIFFITSANSATYVLGVFSESGRLNPGKKVLLTWGLLISGIATVLLLSGGLQGLQAIATITAFPFGIIIIVMIFSIIHSLRQEGREKQKVEEKEDW